MPSAARKKPQAAAEPQRGPITISVDAMDHGSVFELDFR